MLHLASITTDLYTKQLRLCKLLYLFQKCERMHAYVCVLKIMKYICVFFPLNANIDMDIFYVC